MQHGLDLLFSLNEKEDRRVNKVCNLVSSDVELPLASVRVALQQHGTHAEDLLHHCILPQVVLALFTQRGQRSENIQQPGTIERLILHLNLMKQRAIQRIFQAWKVFL